jgi:phosphoglycolate phosphatase-like HAD superfamily hydrolase
MAGHRPCGPAPDLAPVLTGLATRGAHLLVVSAAGAEELFAALRDAGLLPHLRGAAGALRSQRDLRAYLLDHRCRRDRAVFVGGDEAAARTAAWAGYAVGSPCGLVDGTFVGGEPVDVPSVPSVPAVPVA